MVRGMLISEMSECGNCVLEVDIICDKLYLHHYERDLCGLRSLH